MTTADRRPVRRTKDEHGQRRRDRERHEDLDEHDQRLGEAGGIGEEGAGQGKARQADGEKHRRPGDQGEAQPAAADRRRFGEARHDDDQPHGGEDGAALERAARLVGADPDDMDGDDDADRRQQLGEEGQRARRRCVARRGPAMPPQLPSAASDHTPMTARNSTTFSSRVSSARKAIRTAVTGLPSPVSARCRAASGASVAPGSGIISTTAASAAVTTMQSAAASRRDPAPGHSAATAASVAAQAHRGADQQHARHAAADRRLGQRDVDCEQANPDQRHQQPVGDVADDRGEGLARPMVQTATASTSTARLISSARITLMAADLGAAARER